MRDTDGSAFQSGKKTVVAMGCKIAGRSHYGVLPPPDFRPTQSVTAKTQSRVILFMVNMAMKIIPGIRRKISRLCSKRLREITPNPLWTKGRTLYDKMPHLKYDKRTKAA